MYKANLAEQSIAPSTPGLNIEHILNCTESIHSRTVFVHIGGPSAAGKSTLSKLIAARLPGASVFPVDSYLVERLWDPTRVFEHEAPDPTRPYIGGIDPKIWDLDLMEDHLEALRRNRAVSMPVFNETIKDRVGYLNFTPQRFTIVEGGHALSDRFIGKADYSILATAPLHDRITRKIVRTHAIYGRNDVDEIISRYVTKDEPVWRIYEAEHRAVVDQVIENPTNPVSDYAELPGSAAPLPVGTFSALTPRAGLGSLKPGETFGIIHSSSGELHIFYAVYDKCLVNLPLGKDALKLLGEFYHGCEGLAE